MGTRSLWPEEPGRQGQSKQAVHKFGDGQFIPKFGDRAAEPEAERLSLREEEKEE